MSQATAQHAQSCKAGNAYWSFLADTFQESFFAKAQVLKSCCIHDSLGILFTKMCLAVAHDLVYLLSSMVVWMHRIV
jgi:hypothetical protein